MVFLCTYAVCLQSSERHCRPSVPVAAEKAAIAIDHGCDATIIYRDPTAPAATADFAEEAKEWSRDGGGVWTAPWSRWHSAPACVSEHRAMTGAYNLTCIGAQCSPNTLEHALPDVVSSLASAQLIAQQCGPELTPYGLAPQVSVVYDSVGKSTSLSSLASLRPRGASRLRASRLPAAHSEGVATLHVRLHTVAGTCVYFGNASGAPEPIAPLALAVGGSLHITRPILVPHAPPMTP